MTDIGLLAQADVVPFAEDDIYWQGMIGADDLMTVCVIRMVDWQPES